VSEDSALIRRVAEAIKACADGFSSPVRCYVEGEALRRYEQEQGFEAAWDAQMTGRDFDMESWEIIARAAVAAMKAARA
jgi:hypothetical protein